MGSLQDQLLKAGLVNEQQLRDSRSKKRKQRKQAPGKKKGANDVSLAQAYAERARREQADRDRELNRKREEEKRRREINAQLKQIILSNSKNDKKAELPRHFEHNGKIRKLYITKEQQDALNGGKLGIAYVIGRYHLVEASIIEKVKALKAEAVAFFAPDAKSGDDEEMDDYYAKFEVPDDLSW